MARILITGAHGFIGRNLARHLAGEGHTVSGLGHGTWPPSDADLWGISAWINGDVVPGNLALIKRDTGTPDVIFHLAGGSSVGAAVQNPREDFFRTVVSAAELLDWTRLEAPQAAIVAISSAAVYGAGHDGPISEDAPLTPYSPYGHHKRIMEELCRAYTEGYGLRIAVARLFSVYGPGLRKQLLWDICAKLAANPQKLELGGTGGELRDWTHIDDVVRALSTIAPLASASMPVLNVGTGIGTSVERIASLMTRHWRNADAVQQTAERPQPETPVDFSGASRPGDPFSLIANAKPLSDHGFRFARDLDDGLRLYVAWYRQRNGQFN